MHYLRSLITWKVKWTQNRRPHYRVFPRYIYYTFKYDHILVFHVTSLISLEVYSKSRHISQSEWNFYCMCLIANTYNEWVDPHSDLLHKGVVKLKNTRFDREGKIYVYFRTIKLKYACRQYKKKLNKSEIV